MYTQSLSSREVCWAQELSRYYFRIDYQQGKASGAIDALSRFSLIEGRFSSREHSSPSPDITNGPFVLEFVYKTHVLPLLLKFWRCAPEENVLV